VESTLAAWLEASVPAGLTVFDLTASPAKQYFLDYSENVLTEPSDLL
jgi:hypothetical protein